MPLTPEDVRDVVFSRPARRGNGANLEEVRAFLDLVELTLRELTAENRELRAENARLRAERT